MAKLIITFRGTEDERTNFNSIIRKLQKKLANPVSAIIIRALKTLQSLERIK
jgi:hypothetical protein